MAHSPRAEIRVANITEFYLGANDKWYWRTQSPNGEILGDGGQGYKELRKAVHGFFKQQGYDPAAEREPQYQQYSKLYEADKGHFYHIRKYAYGAPEPWDGIIP